MSNVRVKVVVSVTVDSDAYDGTKEQIARDIAKEIQRILGNPEEEYYPHGRVKASAL